MCVWFVLLVYRNVKILQINFGFHLHFTDALRTYVHKCACVCVCMHLCVCVCMCAKLRPRETQRK